MNAKVSYAVASDMFQPFSNLEAPRCHWPWWLCSSCRSAFLLVSARTRARAAYRCAHRESLCVSKIATRSETGRAERDRRRRGRGVRLVFAPMEGGWQLGLQTEPLDDASSQSSSRARRTRIPGRSFSFPADIIRPAGVELVPRAAQLPEALRRGSIRAERQLAVGECAFGDNGSYLNTGRSGMKIGVVGGRTGWRHRRENLPGCLVDRRTAPHDHINVERIEFAPRQRRWVLSTAMRVESEPRNGSMTAVTTSSCLLWSSLRHRRAGYLSVRERRASPRGARTREIISKW